uniref:Uncharacterized protein n=1 Tax=Neospora caninum (strain Liverpool) TaxID=572307 RepID=A0A0F7UFF1_NEOCL|nr:TPA: hypothetical protein BN1204_043870 [Neospora caninum Liverpool]
MRAEMEDRGTTSGDRRPFRSRPGPGRASVPRASVDAGAPLSASVSLGSRFPTFHLSESDGGTARAAASSPPPSCARSRASPRPLAPTRFMIPFAHLLFLFALFPFPGSSLSFNSYDASPPPQPLPSPREYSTEEAKFPPPPYSTAPHSAYPLPPPVAPTYHVGDFVARAPLLAPGATPADVEAFQQFYQAEETPFDVPPADPVARPVAVPRRRTYPVQDPSATPPVPRQGTGNVRGIGVRRPYTVHPDTAVAMHEVETAHAARVAEHLYPATAELFSRLGQPFPVYTGHEDKPWWQVRGTGYDYSPDFYSTTESLTNVKEDGARMAIELIQGALRGTPAYPEQQLKVVLISKRYSGEAWDIASEALLIPTGHNPQLGHLLVAVMLNISVHVQRSCVSHLSELGPQVEARPRAEDQRTVRLVKNRDLNLPLRDFVELRLIFERVSKKETACLAELEGRLGQVIPKRMYHHLPRVSLQTLLLIPTPDDRPLDTYDAPSSDGLVTYNFVQPFRTSVLTQIDIRRDTDLALGQLSSMLVKATQPATQQCGILWTRFTPAYTALVMDSSGALYHVPLSKKTITLRQLLAVSQVIRSRINQEVTVTLNIFFPALLKSEALAVHRCRPDLWKQLVPSYIPLGGYRLTVLVNVECTGVIKVRCRRRSFSLTFTNPFTTVADALLALRPFIRTDPGEALGKRQSQTCFVGYSRLKRKEQRVFNMGQPWRELDGSALLSEFVNKEEPLLLAPKTSIFRTEASTAQTFCASYLPVLAQTPIVVRPYFLDFSPDETLRLHPIFGDTALRILRSPFAQE